MRGNDPVKSHAEKITLNTAWEPPCLLLPCSAPAHFRVETAESCSLSPIIHSGYLLIPTHLLINSYSSARGAFLRHLGYSSPHCTAPCSPPCSLLWGDPSLQAPPLHLTPPPLSPVKYEHLPGWELILMLLFYSTAPNMISQSFWECSWRFHCCG